MAWECPANNDGVISNNIEKLWQILPATYAGESKPAHWMIINDYIHKITEWILSDSAPGQMAKLFGFNVELIYKQRPETILYNTL